MIPANAETGSRQGANFRRSHMRAPRQRLLAATLLLTTLAAGAAPAAQRAQPVTRQQFDAWMQQISNWGRWGKDDELGTINLITPEKRKAAAALVRDGVTVSLALDLNKERDGNNGNPFEHQLSLGKLGEQQVASDRYSVQYHGFAHSHIDGLPHFAHKGKFYNGFAYEEAQPNGARKLGIHNMKEGIVTRGVLVDMPW